MITTTLNRIRSYCPCETGWRRLLAGLGKTAADDEPLSFARIVYLNGPEDATWCCRAEPQYAREWRLFGVWGSRLVQHLMIDPRSVAALDVAERYANGQASDDELTAARDAAWDDTQEGPAREAAKAAWYTVFRDPGRAPWAVRNVAMAAAWDAADGATRCAARDAAWDAAWAAQTTEFLRVVTETEARS